MSEMNDRIRDKSITKVLSGDFIDYSMSVIVARAIPDVRDGLKPVHRRILYAMSDLGMTPDKPFKKSARIVGEVIGKYHPHGDSAVYDSMVRMAQSWSMREMLIHGHGNFGSIDDDPPAAMRYTEAKLQKISMELLRGLKSDTVDFADNFDETEKEPKVLPARFPNLLVNGSEGIAVGMATKIPPHNLREVCEAVIAQIDNPEITIDELMNYVKGPDFPTGSRIMGEEGIKSAYRTGKGSISVRGVVEVVEKKKKTKIYIKEIPFQVSKEKLVSDIRKIQDDWDDYLKERAKKKSKAKRKGFDFSAKDGVNDLSDRDNPILIEIELKKDVNPEVVLNHLYKSTDLEKSFPVNNLALVPKRISGKTILEPKVLTLKDTIREYIKHQKEVVTRELEFELRKKEAKMHEIQGLIKALDRLDETIKTIRESESRLKAKVALIDMLSIDEVQADYILDLRLHKLTSGDQELEREKYETLKSEIEEIRKKLADEKLIYGDIKEDLREISEKYGTDRKTKLCPPAEEYNAEDFIEDDEVVVTVTNKGFIKRTLGTTYRTQRRKGVGVNAMEMYDDDFIRHIQIARNLDTIMFFTNKGRVYKKKVYEITEAQANARGKNIQLLLDLESDETIQAILSVRKFSSQQFLLFTTTSGIVKKTRLSEYANIRQNGIKAIKLDSGDRVIGVSLTNGKENVTLVTKYAMSITFNEDEIRTSSRDTRGVKGISLKKNDWVISSGIHEKGAYLFVATNQGYGKRTLLDEFRTQSRGGKGVSCAKLTDKNGKIVGSEIVQDEDGLMLITKKGTLIRLNVSEISTYGRTTQGTSVIRLRGKDELRGVARLVETEEEIEEVEE